jgi:hypothetical protein
MAPFQKTASKNCCKNKKPAGICCASGLKSVLISDLLSTPQSTRRMTVMMMTTGVVNENHERKE